MDLRTGDLVDLEGRLQTAVARIGTLQAGTRVRSDDFFSESFMRDHTQFDSFTAFCEASPWSLEDSRNIRHVRGRRLDTYVADMTDFEDWEAMKTQAAEEEIVDYAASSVA
ncbi:hypothetical protein [Natrinema amylolyticum]|uniref:hypothetical protein n=1 Tax=Natrinema amylolyticum TaxID=2878679 RepID=UPI001CF9FA56|nr:hypothetical protein [Natrinema amylolyticum]